MSYDEDPLDLLEDDGDGVVEMALFFDDDKDNGISRTHRGSGGCSVAFLLLSTSFISAGITVFNLFAS